MSDSRGIHPGGVKNKEQNPVLLQEDYVEGEAGVAVPDSYECPITTDLMQDPVVAADGHSYERKAMEEWLAGGKRISPATGAKLAHTLLTPNYGLRKAIQDFLKQRPGLAAIQKQARTMRTLEQEMKDLALAIHLREEELAARAAKSLPEEGKEDKEGKEGKREIGRQMSAPKLALSEAGHLLPAKQVAPPLSGPHAAIESASAIARQKNHPRTQIANTLLKLTTTEATLDQLRKESAANKIKRFYLTYRKGGLKAWMKASRLQAQEGALSHQLKQSLASQGKQREEFKPRFEAQEKAWAEEREAVKAKHEAEIKKAAALGAWVELQRLAKEAADAEQKVQGRHEKARGAFLEGLEKADQKHQAEQAKLKQELKQVDQAKSDKYRGVVERVKPITALDKAIQVSEQQQAVLVEEQAKLAIALTEQTKVQRKPARLGKVGIFKPEEKKLEMKLDPKQVDQVLTYVAYGQQDEAEALLKKEPYLALTHGAVSDPGGRTFKRITAFQYAVWALDWHMWEMMLRCFKEEHYTKAAEQYIELDTKGTEHGKQFSLDPLIEALKTYCDKFAGWTGEQRKQHWCKVVGGEQAKLAMHVINEYCRPDRSFEQTKDMFEEKALPRWKGREKEWHHWDGAKEQDGRYKYTMGGVGGDWAWTRGRRDNPIGGNWGAPHEQYIVDIVEWSDLKALSLLSTLRNQQKSKLGQSLVSPKPKIGVAL